jgi:predicted enzyme related to lactoylglutathione lyase
MVHFEIRARDRKRLTEFYRTLFHWEGEEREGVPVTFFEPGIGGPVEGVAGHIIEADASSVVIYVQVVDPVETTKQAEAMGGKKVSDPFDVPGGPTIAYIEDPEGNVVALVKQ